MTIYRAEIICGRLKVRSAEVKGDDIYTWAIDSRNEVQPCCTRVEKSEVYGTADEAIDALMDRLRSDINRATAEIKTTVRHLELCHEWQRERKSA